MTYLIDVLDVEAWKTGRVAQVFEPPRSVFKKRERF